MPTSDIYPIPKEKIESLKEITPETEFGKALRDTFMIMAAIGFNYDQAQGILLQLASVYYPRIFDEKKAKNPSAMAIPHRRRQSC